MCFSRRASRRYVFYKFFSSKCKLKENSTLLKRRLIPSGGGAKARTAPLSMSAHVSGHEAWKWICSMLQSLEMSCLSDRSRAGWRIEMGLCSLVAVVEAFESLGSVGSPLFLLLNILYFRNGLWYQNGTLVVIIVIVLIRLWMVYVFCAYGIVTNMLETSFQYHTSLLRH